MKKIKTRTALFLICLISTLCIFNEPINAQNGDMYPTLMCGSKSESVAYLQKLLSNAGYYHDTIDGSFGPYTQSCVMYFQEANHLAIDGIVGPQTWNALLNSKAWNLNSYEQTLLAELIYHEAGSVSYECQYYVGCAILNLTVELDRSLESIAYDFNVFEVAPYFMDNIDAGSTQWAIVERLMNEGPQSNVKYFRTDYYHYFGTPQFEVDNVYFSS